MNKSSTIGYKIFALSMAFLAFSDAIGSQLVKEGFAPTLLILIRSAYLSIFSLALVLLTTKAKEIFPTHGKSLIFIRGIFQGCTSVFYFLSFQYIPFSMAASLFLCAPIALLAFSPLLLGEKVSIRQWFTVLLGFVGVFFVINPLSIDFSNLSADTTYIGFLFALIAMFFSMLLQIFTRKIANNAPAYVLTFWGNVISVIIAFLFCIMQKVDFSILSFSQVDFTWHISIITLVALLAFLGQVLYVIPSRYVRAAALAPFNYFQLAITVIIGITFFSEKPPLLACLGMALIFFAASLQGYYIKKNIN